jgi:hypothetical protein
MTASHLSQSNKKSKKKLYSGVAALGIADWLCLAAAPAFAGMALLNSLFRGHWIDMPCVADQGGSLLNGMVPMYLLMAAFHLTPWLNLISSRNGGVRQAESG